MIPRTTSSLAPPLSSFLRSTGGVLEQEFLEVGHLALALCLLALMAISAMCCCGESWDERERVQRCCEFSILDAGVTSRLL